MRKTVIPLIAALVVLLFFAALLSLYGLSSASPNDPVPVICTTTYSPSSFSAFTPISIDSPGTYCFEAGTYNTQITVTSDNVVLAATPGTSPSQVVIQPTAASATAQDPDTGQPEAPIILVQGATGVIVQGLTVNGSQGSAPTACSPNYIGILFLGASGEVIDSTVENINLQNVNLYGCQSGDGILVQSPSSQSSTVSIVGNNVVGYQKNGITCNDQGTTCAVNDNTVSALTAAQPYIAQNGIQIGFGAVGSVTGNTVSGNECDLSSICGPNYITQTQGSGILTYESGQGTVIRHNTVEGNDIGILSYGGIADLMNNVVQNNRFEGMYLSDGTFTSTGNRVSGGNIGIAVVSDGFVDNPTTVTINGPPAPPPPPPPPPGASTSVASSTFSVSAIQVVAFTGSPYGGSYSEPVYLTINGFSETITPGSSATPSFVNIAQL